MTIPAADPEKATDSVRSVHVCITATVAGVLIGVVGGAFRWCLEEADRLRIDVVVWAQGLPGPGWLVPMAAARELSPVLLPVKTSVRAPVWLLKPIEPEFVNCTAPVPEASMSPLAVPMLNRRSVVDAGPV